MLDECRRLQGPGSNAPFDGTDRCRRRRTRTWRSRSTCPRTGFTRSALRNGKPPRNTDGRSSRSQ
ncbi:hypothetical protein LC55x_4930 [Lysobacter capsici]|nr:hypothetical protein LC55x_4930 [Lysobacter capsici]